MKAILRALLGRWPIIAVSVVACVLGGLVVVVTSPPRYSGSARVVLDYVKPDPITGAVVPSKMLDAYISSQIGLIRDFQVTGPAVESLGFLENPDVQQSYYLNPPADGRDLHTWIAAQVAAAASGAMVGDTNILEIRYVASSPELAETVVDALRTAFIESSARGLRMSSDERSDSLASRIQSSKATLAQLEALQRRFEDEAGISVNEQGKDEELAKLTDMVGRPRPAYVARQAPTSPAAAKLAELDARIEQASASMGPNNPNLIAMKDARGLLAADATTEADRGRMVGEMVAANERATAEVVAQQTARVLAVREPTLRLRLMQDEINRRRTELNKMIEQLIEARTLAGVDTSSTQPIGPAVGKRTPVFPNIPLILFGSAGLGLVGGSLLALLIELFARRIRSGSDLEVAANARLLGEVPDLNRLKRARRKALKAGVPKRDEAVDTIAAVAR